MTNRKSRKRKRSEELNAELTGDEHPVSNDGDEEEETAKRTWEAFREEFYEAVEQLPLSLKRSFLLMRELDVETQGLVESLVPTVRNYIDFRLSSAAQQGTTPTNRTNGSRLPSRSTPNTPEELDPGVYNAQTSQRAIRAIAVLSSDLLRGAEEKYNLAEAAYNSVDRHIRLLDQAIQEQEASLPLNVRLGSLPLVVENDNPVVGPKLVNSSQADTPQGLQSERLTRSSRLRRTTTLSRGHTSTSNQDGDDSVGSTQMKLRITVPRPQPSVFANDMPIDPNEPRYCFCNEVGFGEMIGCDAPDCEREWFHMACAGLTEAPKSNQKWYCRECKDKMKVTIRRKGH